MVLYAHSWKLHNVLKNGEISECVMPVGVGTMQWSNVHFNELYLSLSISFGLGVQCERTLREFVFLCACQTANTKTLNDAIGLTVVGSQISAFSFPYFTQMVNSD